MKTIFSILFFFSVIVHSFSQTTELTGAAKTFGKMFWQSIENKDVVSAEKYLGYIKKNQADADLTSFEKALNDLKSSTSTNTQQNENVEGNNSNRNQTTQVDQNEARKFKDLLNKLFDKDMTYYLNITDDNGITEAKGIIETYNSNVKELLAMDISSLSQSQRSYFNDAKRYMELTADGFNTEIDRLAYTVKNAVDKYGSYDAYYELLYIQSWYDASQKVFSDNQKFKDAYNLISQKINDLGDPKNFESNVNANIKKSLDSVKIPNAVRTDSNMEKLFKDAFTREGWNETILKVNLLDTDWHIERNSITGIILGRYQTAAIVAKNSKGDCILYTFSIKQDYDGSTYKSAAYRYGHNASFMSCENVK